MTVVDDLGSELGDFQLARTQAVEALPEVARNGLSRSGEYRRLVTTIRDEGGNALYRATLTFTGEHLLSAATDANDGESASRSLAKIG